MKLFCGSDKIEENSSALLDFQVGGIEINDFQDFNRYLQEEKEEWEIVDDELIKQLNQPTSIVVYLSNDENGLAELERIRKRFQNLKIESTNIKEEDWENNWKAYYKPFWVKDKILICPLWEREEHLNDLAVYIDPGSAFGTGTHETTKMCIEHLTEFLVEGQSVLDIGCGSGILAISAMKLGARSAQLIDISPLAVKIARENGEINGLYEPEYAVKVGNLTDDVDGQYDIITANIIADSIIVLCKEIGDYMKEKTVFITSGIIQERAAEVEQAFAENQLAVMQKKELGDWVSYAVSKVNREKWATHK